MNLIREALSEGRPSFGIWAAAPSAVGAEVLGRAGLDWVILDQQHGAVHAGDLLSLIQALELGGTPALVRVAENDPALIMRALDLGAAGVVVPMVSTPAQARTAGAATRYPPDGERSFGPVRTYYGAGGERREPTCLVMIETAEALANLDAIAATPTVDGLFVGPVDLGLALGVGLQLTGHEAVTVAVRKIVDAARRHGIITGVAGLAPDHVEEMLVAGVDMVTLGADVGYLRAAVIRDRERARQLAADHPRTKPQD